MASLFFRLRKISTEMLCIIEQQRHNKEYTEVIAQILTERCEKMSVLTLCDICYRDRSALLTSIAAHLLSEKLFDSVSEYDRMEQILGKKTLCLLRACLSEEEMPSFLKSSNSNTYPILELYGFQNALSHMSTPTIVRMSKLPMENIVPELAREEYEKRLWAQCVDLEAYEEDAVGFVKQKRKVEKKDD